MIGCNARIMFYKMFFRLCVILYFGMQYSTSAVVIYANERSNITLSCSSSRNYPSWTGPEGLYNYANTANISNFNPALGEKLNRLSWGQNKMDLVISNVVRNDRGQYSCYASAMNLTVRVPPSAPTVLETEYKDDVGLIVRGSEGVALTLTCRSSGGFPASDMVWMKGSTHLQTSKNETYINSSETYNIIGSHTFMPSSSDDGVQFICKTLFEIGPDNAQQTEVTLFLSLKPSKPKVTQTSSVSIGGTVEVRCTTTGCRPAANISWSYQGSTATGEVTATLDATTETYTVVSLFRRRVTAADNGRTVQCIVTHQTLISPSEKTASVNLNIHFGPSTTRITGNKEIIATGQTSLTLTCTTGSSNPASDITWKNGSETLSSSRPYSETTGDNNGFVISQQLILYPTRYMDGDVIVCSVSNTVSQSDVVDTITLNLKYSPLVTIQGQEQNTLTEGESKQLFCKVDSKPPATIKWYYGSTLISQGTPISNVLNYSLTPINRTHYGNYICRADNGIGSEHQEQISITVRFKPLTTTITGNSNVIANGKNTLPLLCISGSSNPVSDITWRINSVIRPSNGSLSDQSGEYGGMKRRRRLTLTPTRDNHGDSISCEAYNSIGTSEINTVTLDLRYRPLIQPMAEIIAVEGNTTGLTCIASSKPASTFKWYREGHSGILHQGTGTLASNKLTYTIRYVRRTDAAIYRCNANNGIETADNKNVLLSVYYPPDVTATTTNTTVKAKTVVIMCNARGVPNSNYRYGKWTQTWPGYNFPVSEKPGSEKLVLTDVTYEHSGVYTCSASNGIKVFGTNKEFMEGSVQLILQSFPIFTNVSKKIPAELNGNTTVEAHYYSNIAGSSVKIYRNRNGARQEGVIYTVSETRVEINLPVFKHIIKTGGTRARIFIQILSMDDLGLYDVVVSNEIDSDTRSFEIVLKGPPSKPSDVRVDMIQYDKARLSWIRGYHGGFAQTFVIQLSTDLSNWRNVTVYGGNDESSEPVSHVLSGLHDSTTYYVRMYAFNKEENSSLTENLNYTTPPIKEKECGHTGDSSVLIVGLVLGLVIVVVVTYAIYITVQQRRKQVFIQKEDISEQANKQMYVNLAVSPEGGANIKKKKERENNTLKDDAPSENQYTELNKQLRDQESAYEAISSM
ncbi:sialoadhesin-like [Mercenaria mercenaria]|uniref:sialoadhesin-like n=1 Tax=Mercenaria mercenaria TaxID=6596 RepID=UPI00234E7282|nr:sialoadhesin-like [Mercenaria mercenaria]